MTIESLYTDNIDCLYPEARRAHPQATRGPLGRQGSLVLQVQDDVCTIARSDGQPLELLLR